MFQCTKCKKCNFELGQLGHLTYCGFRYILHGHKLRNWNIKQVYFSKSHSALWVQLQFIIILWVRYDGHITTTKTKQNTNIKDDIFLVFWKVKKKYKSGSQRCRILPAARKAEEAFCFSISLPFYSWLLWGYFITLGNFEYRKSKC